MLETFFFSPVQSSGILPQAPQRSPVTIGIKMWLFFVKFFLCVCVPCFSDRVLLHLSLGLGADAGPVVAGADGHPQGLGEQGEVLRARDEK